MFMLSYKINTRQNLVELEKAVKTLPMAGIPTALLFLPNFHKCFYNSIETRYMFSILMKIIVSMYVLPLCWIINCTFIWQMSLGILPVLVLLTVSLSGVDGINGTVSPSVSNSSSAVNVSITTVPTTQITTELSTNATQNATPGIKIGDCYGFDVFVLNNQLNIPYTVTCCIAVLCGFYLILFGKICRNKHVWVLVSETVNLVHLSLFCRPET